MDFIKLHPDTLTKDYCDELIAKYLKENCGSSTRRDHNLHGTVQEFCVTGEDGWEDIEKFLGK